MLVLLATGLGVIPWIAYASLYADAVDARAYFYAEPGNLYNLPWGEVGAYVYTPAFSQAIEPLRWLGYEGFLTAWRLLETAGLAAISGPWTGPLLFVYPVPLEIGTGNVQLLLAAAIVAGFRWPWAWSLVLLTKITPGVGLLWFAMRREWRNLGIALGATAGIAAVSFAIAPDDWLDWATYMAQPHNLGPGAFQVVTAPLWLRLVAAAALIAWGARTDRRWTVLVAAFLALPSVWLPSVSMLAGVWALRTRLAQPITTPHEIPGSSTARSTSSPRSSGWCCHRWPPNESGPPTGVSVDEPSVGYLLPACAGCCPLAVEHRGRYAGQGPGARVKRDAIRQMCGFRSTMRHDQEAARYLRYEPV